VSEVLVLVDTDIRGYLVAPKAEVLAQLVRTTSPAAVLIASGGEGKEIAGRLAVKTESGLITDAVDVQAGEGGPVTTQGVFAVRTRCRRGSPRAPRSSP
jgi:electron transfer flavoprotein alpha subunit